MQQSESDDEDESEEEDSEEEEDDDDDEDDDMSQEADDDDDDKSSFGSDDDESEDDDDEDEKSGIFLIFLHTYAVFNHQFCNVICLLWFVAKKKAAKKPLPSDVQEGRTVFIRCVSPSSKSCTVFL